ncbi:MAG: hypothetical protein ACD_3C00046G0003 [uncultured bacterium (gcode 4)]|uniref:Uncharacterized protein n=1 Tax=uncultured bacterium (gcode 4) TaxID=1234023 RepID=K2GYN7_9BACT|nr:MAG: hypothetical protein ACD_3C00046G0003 [uncultured bacterium (gcode 4)]
MDHIAILNPKWKLLWKISSWEKIIESRWYKTRRIPWNNVRTWDIVYFKDAWKRIILKANVDKVLQFENLDSEKFKDIVNNYGKSICLLNTDYAWYSTKKYCILIFISEPVEVVPFDIDKAGFWIWSAWISIDDIEQIRKD